MSQQDEKCQIDNNENILLVHDKDTIIIKKSSPELVKDVIDREFKNPRISFIDVYSIKKINSFKKKVSLQKKVSSDAVD